jgi:hypothetical protein
MSFLAVHGQGGSLFAEPNLQVAALGGLERATLLFQPPLELGASHDLRVQQMCCVVNRTVSQRPHARRRNGDPNDSEARRP